MKSVIAAFDFDKTITTRDTLLPFLFGLHSRRQNMLNALKLLPTAVRYQLGHLENHIAKERILTTFLPDYTLPYLIQQAETFAHRVIPQWVRPQALQRIYWHHAQGHRCILLSAGLEIYLQFWAAAFPFETVLATRLSVEQNQVTGKINGRNCFGQEKVNRLLAYAGPRENFTLYAYGDSRGDRELLAAADYPFYRHMPL